MPYCLEKYLITHIFFLFYTIIAVYICLFFFFLNNHFYKGNNLCIPVCFLGQKALPEWGLLLEGREMHLW